MDKEQNNKRNLFFITGKLGSGKSTVAKYFKYKNYDVISLDVMAKAAMNSHNFLIAKIKEVYGEGVLTKYSNINFDLLKQVYFEEQYDEGRKQFELMLDDCIINPLKSMVYNENKQNIPLFIEIPLVLKERYTRYTEALNPDNIIYVHSDNKDINDRLHKKGLSDKQIKNITRLQEDDFDFISTDSLVYKVGMITNFGTEEDLFNETTKFIKERIAPRLAMKSKKDMIVDYMDKISPYQSSEVICNMYKNTGGCAACPFPCEKCIEK